VAASVIAEQIMNTNKRSVKACLATKGEWRAPDRLAGKSGSVRFLDDGVVGQQSLMDAQAFEAACPRVAIGSAAVASYTTPGDTT
jgi:hypothetical protein